MLSRSLADVALPAGRRGGKRHYANLKEKRGKVRQSKEHGDEMKSGEVRCAKARHRSTEVRCHKLRRGAMSGGEAQSSEVRYMAGSCEARHRAARRGGVR